MDGAQPQPVAVCRRSVVALMLLVATIVGAPVAGAHGPHEVIEQARTLFRAGNQAQAITMLSAYVKSNADDLLVTRELVGRLLDTSRAIDAIPYARRVVRLSPGDAGAQERLAAVYEAAAWPAQAAAVLERLSRRSAAGVRLLGRLAELYRKAGRLSEAAETLHRIVQAREDHKLPVDTAVLRSLAELRDEIGHRRDALLAYSALSEALKHRDAGALRNIGRLRRLLDQEEFAIAAYEKAHRLEPKHADTMRHLAQLYGWNGKPKRRIAMLRRLLAVANGDNDARVALSRTLLEQGREAEAAVYLARVVRDRPDDLQLKLKLAELYEATDQYDEAVEVLVDIEARDSTNAGTSRMLAGVYRGRGERNVALAMYRELNALQPGNPVIEQAVAELELEVLPRLSARYSFFNNRLEQFRHTARVWFEHEPIPLIRYRAGYQYAWNKGRSVTSTSSVYELQSHSGFAGISFRLAPRTFLDLDFDADVYIDNDPFFGSRVALRHRLQRPVSFELAFARAQELGTIDALFQETAVYDVSLTMDAEPVNRWLLRASGSYGHYRHTNLATGERVGNHGGKWALETGARVVETPVNLELTVDYEGEAFDRTSDGPDDIPYFAPELYQTLGLKAFLEHRPHWRFRYSAFARPHWVVSDEALQIAYGVEVEFKMHKKHLLQLSFDRTDTAVGETDAVYNENVLMALYIGVF